MSDTINTTRALLRLFEQSGYGDLHVRSGNYALFVARSDGQSNPMRASAASGVNAASIAAPEVVQQSAAFIVSAPHIASMVSALDVGSAVQAGDAVARIEVLGEMIDLFAEAAGLIETVAIQPGALLEYGDAVVTLIGAN